MVPETRPEPVFNAPGIVIFVIAGLAAIHAALELVPTDIANEWIWRLAFVPARYGPEGELLPGGLTSQIGTPVTHMLVHGDWIHLLINSAWLLAFGSMVARRMSAARFLAYAALCGAGGALLFWLANPYAAVAMVGASGAVSGLMGGVFRFMFNAPNFGGFQVLREAPRAVPLMTISQALQTRAVLIVVGLWLSLNLLFATDFSSLVTSGEIAWEAHIGGFVVGFLTVGWFDQGLQPPVRDQLSF